MFIDFESAIGLIMAHYQSDEGAGWHHCDRLAYCWTCDVDVSPHGTLQRRGDVLRLVTVHDVAVSS